MELKILKSKHKKYIKHLTLINQIKQITIEQSVCLALTQIKPKARLVFLNELISMLTFLSERNSERQKKSLLLIISLANIATTTSLIG